MNAAASTFDATADSPAYPLLTPLVTGQTHGAPEPLEFDRVPPIRVSLRSHADSVDAASGNPALTETPQGMDPDVDLEPTGADEIGTEPDPGWRDELPDWQPGIAEPEDELPLLPAHRPTSTGLPARPHIEQIAGQLEGIARTLRQYGSPAPLLAGGEGRDPLTALVTGYLIGYFEGAGKREADGNGATD